ncbi:protein C19orf12 homolog isoform X3 [Bombus terrestris]|uniref:Protein C19orf12 homolog isoform X3 n=1 Tax=Bombus terrestris TaxID=30195 RepID=A0A9C6SJ60_BOMTE|nr:protein C19orf12 homolog isoform X3 [Bombus terrestris]
MDFPTDELLKEVLQYPAVQSMKVTVSSCGKYAVIIGGSAFLGGLIGGPIGLALVQLLVLYQHFSDIMKSNLFHISFCTKLLQNKEKS